MYEDHHTPIIMKSTAAVAAWADMVAHDRTDAALMVAREHLAESTGASVSRQVTDRIREMLITGWNYYGLHKESVY